jgi:hypothetical protein
MSASIRFNQSDDLAAKLQAEMQKSAPQSRHIWLFKVMCYNERN